MSYTISKDESTGAAVCSRKKFCALKSRKVVFAVRDETRGATDDKPVQFRDTVELAVETRSAN
jgi:hypothetical protein